jgi:hypothetical protein
MICTYIMHVDNPLGDLFAGCVCMPLEFAIHSIVVPPLSFFMSTFNALRSTGIRVLHLTARSLNWCESH